MWNDPVSQAILTAGSSFTKTLSIQSIGPLGTVTIPVQNKQAAVQYSLGQQVGRSAAFMTTRDYLDAGVLDPLTCQIYIQVGVATAPNIPLFTGRVLQTQDNRDGSVQVTCNDLADDVVKNDFSVPWATNAFLYADNTAGAEIARIINDANPAFNTDYSGLVQVPVPTLMWEISRGQAIEDLAQGANGLWRADRVGGFTVFQNPYTFTPSTPAPIILKDGVNGTLVDVQHTQSRPRIFNQITIIVERMDPSLAPIRISARDANPNSPTRWGGPFGYRNRTIKIQTPNDITISQSLVIRLLQQSLALAETWQVKVPFMPLLDQGDLLGVWYRGVVNNTVVESATINFAADGETTLTCRKLQLQDPTLIQLIGN